MWSSELLCGREELGFSELILNGVWRVGVAGNAESSIYVAGNILCSNRDTHVLCASVGD